VAVEKGDAKRLDAAPGATVVARDKVAWESAL